MDTLMELQNLAVTVNGLKESIDLTATRVSSISNSNNNKTSRYHSTFSELLNKYSGFAVEYKSELDNLHKLLLNDINLQQKDQERREREFQEKLESLSNKSSHSNLEIAENVEETEYHSSTNSTSVNMNHMNSLSSLNSPQQRDDSELENESMSVSHTVSMEIPISIPSPQQMQSKKSVPISAPKAATKPSPTQKKRSNKGNTKKSNKTKPKNPRSSPKNNNKAKAKPAAAPKSKVATKPKPKPTAKVSNPMVVRTVTADIEKKENEQMNDQEDKYVYKADKVSFIQDFREWNEEKERYVFKVCKHTTVIYIGNIPSNIKVAAVQFFIMKKFKVTMRQIEETKLNSGRGFTQYALVRFRKDVPLDYITKYMQMLNGENAKIAEEKKKAKDTMYVAQKKSSKKDKKDGDDKNKEKKPVKTSWQTRVFIKFQDPEYHYSYYENEDAMYSDHRARHALFIRNFDVLNKKCHKELTDKLLEFGDLVKDIDIKTDQFGDPFCIVIFKYLHDAVYCCNSDVYFGGRRLEIRYSKYD